ncbi:MAG: DNA alkylation repair protein [Proteobacteria bacterium]|nr:DNA alkylation repair protein [Pseudomonadota bacterium]
MNLDTLRSRLEHHYDASYASFHSKLVPETRYPIHGVRIPILRKIAKEISKAPDLDQALEAQRASFAREVPTFEEVMVHLLTIAYRRDTPDEMHRRAQPSFSLIDNWAHCDTFSVTYAKNLFRDARGIEIIHALICTHDL